MKTLKQVLRRNFDTVGGAVVAALTETEANYAQEGVALPQRARSHEDGSQVGTALTA